jgi:Penicillin amidase
VRQATGRRTTQWELAPYTEADLQRQFDMGDDVYGAAGAALQDDVTNYVAGINHYITEARLNPLKMPGEYAAIGKPGPQDWKVTDVIATASLIGGIFGKGGGSELDSALLLQDTRTRFGRRSGKRVWADLRTAEDPEAPVTVNPAQRFPYRAEPRRLRRGSVALPDRGSVRKLDVVKGDAAASASGRGDTGLGGLLYVLRGRRRPPAVGACRGRRGWQLRQCRAGPGQLSRWTGGLELAQGSSARGVRVLGHNHRDGR